MLPLLFLPQPWHVKPLTVPEPAEPGLGACEESEEEAAHKAFQGDSGDLGGATKQGAPGDPVGCGLW